MRYRLVAFMILLFSVARGQVNNFYHGGNPALEIKNFGLELKVGYGSYAMTSLKKDLHYYEDLIQDSIPIKIVNDYPPYYNFGFSGFLDFEDWELGANFTFSSTAGRVHYKDYSGEVGLEHLLKGQSFGSFARLKFLRKEKFNADFTVQMSYLHTSLTANAWHRVGTTEDRQSGDFFSNSFAFTVMMGAKYYLTPWLCAGGRFGVMLDSKGPLRMVQDKNIRLVNYQGEDMNSDWTGFRAEVFIGFRMKAAEL